MSQRRAKAERRKKLEALLALPGPVMQPGIHWPYCIDMNCAGCLPEFPR